MSDPADRHGAGFWVALAVGWAVIGLGVVGLMRAKYGISGALEVGAWVVGGHAVHDLLLAPAVFLVGILVARVLRPGWRAPIHFGLAASIATVAVAYPALAGYGRKPRNPTVLPLDYATAVLTVVGVVWLIVGVWLAALGARARRRDTAGIVDTPVPTGGGSTADR